MTKTKPAVETNTYFARAVFPPAVSWKSGWLTKTEAIKSAERFVQQWRDWGLRAEATVFYRDGSAVYHAQ